MSPHSTVAFRECRGGNPVGGARDASPANPAHRQREVENVLEVRAGDRGRITIGLYRIRTSRVEWDNGLV